MSLLDYQTYFLVGIKGVAMTSLAQCLADAGKTVLGSDVAEDFVTKPHLDRLAIHPSPLSDDLPSNIDCLVYTAAHQGPQNSQVLAAQKAGLPIFSQAEALAELFNQKQGVAVCGVGGKSTTSAMLAWIYTWLHQKDGSQYAAQSFSVGVGNIPGIEKTGQWNPASALFIAEADDYVTDPAAPNKGEAITPRFSFLKPHVLTCTNLKYDHPDVYRDFDHTQQVFLDFFKQTKPNGYLVVNGDDQPLLALAQKAVSESEAVSLVTYGWQPHNQIQLIDYRVGDQRQAATLVAPDTSLELSLLFPGQYNLTNALAAVVAAQLTGVPYADSVAALAEFKSTQRRFEHIGSKQGVEYYDDYAHHPHEVASAIQAIQAWYPGKRTVVGFQSHTYSRTKELFDQFVDALSLNSEIVMLDIFPSAREKIDKSISSNMLCQAIQEKTPSISAQNLGSLEKMAAWCQNNLKDGDVFITLGAGNIYHLHELL